MRGICRSESAQVIMCKSLRNMFKVTYYLISMSLIPKFICNRGGNYFLTNFDNNSIRFYNESVHFLFQGLHADKLHSCNFDCNIPQLDEMAEPRLASTIDHQGAVSGITREDSLIPEALSEHAAAAVTASGGVPESHSLNSSPSICFIHSIFLLLISIIFS